MPKMGVAPRHPNRVNKNYDRPMVEGQAVTINTARFEDAMDTYKILQARGLPIPEDIERIVFSAGHPSPGTEVYNKRRDRVAPRCYGCESVKDVLEGYCRNCDHMRYVSRVPEKYISLPQCECGGCASCAGRALEKQQQQIINLDDRFNAIRQTLEEMGPVGEIEEPDPYEGMDDLDKWLAVHDDVLWATFDEVLAVQTADEVVPSQKPKPEVQRERALYFYGKRAVTAVIACTFVVIASGVAVGMVSVLAIALMSLFATVMAAVAGISAHEDTIS